MQKLKESEQFRQFIQGLTGFLFADHNVESVEKIPGALSIALYDGTRFHVLLKGPGDRAKPVAQEEPTEKTVRKSSKPKKSGQQPPEGAESPPPA